jgi:hypothetical protein
MPGFERISILCHYTGDLAVLNADLLYRRIEDDVNLAVQFFPDPPQDDTAKVRTDMPDPGRDEFESVPRRLSLETR